MELSREELVLLCYGARTIWFNRNLLIHEREGLSIPEAAAKTISTVGLILKHDYKISVVENDGACNWSPPRRNYLKINTDGSWLKLEKKAGYGCIVRNSEGMVMGVSGGVEEGILSSLEAEGKALLKAMLWAADHRWRRCLFEVDCALVVDSILKHRGSSGRPLNWIDECATMLMTNEKWQLSLIRREANNIADAVAKKAAMDNWSWRSSVAVPNFIGALL